MVMTVHKLNTRGETVVTYQGVLAEWLPDGVRIEARWTRPLLPLGYTTFVPGDQFIEWYFTTRWYNIFEIHAADGTLKGWYCNVTEPAVISGDAIYCRDLLLDLWVAPDGRTRVLDADEFENDTALDTLTRQRARQGLEELERLVAAREPPFSTVS